MAEFTPVNVVGNFLSGRQAKQDYESNQLQMKQQQENHLMRQKQFEQQQMQLSEEQKRQAATKLYQAAQYALQSDRPKAFLEANYPELVQLAGPAWATADDNMVRQKMQDALGIYGPKAGIGPAAPGEPGPLESFIDPSTGQPVFGTRRQAIGNRPYDKPPAVVQQFTPVQTDVGVGAFNSRTGQITQTGVKAPAKVTQSAAERKATLEAKVKMPRVSAAMRRAERLDEAIQAIAKNRFADGGPADAKILQYTKDGREVLAAAAQLMPELQALTRVPGIGSQSDLEARLASLALPSLEFDPQTNAKSMAELHAFIQDLKAAYETMASGGQPADVPEEVGPAVSAPNNGWSIKPL